MSGRFTRGSRWCLPRLPGGVIRCSFAHTHEVSVQDSPFCDLYLKEGKQVLGTGDKKVAKGRDSEARMRSLDLRWPHGEDVGQHSQEQ